MSYFIVGSEGLDIYPNGVLSTFPFTNMGANAGVVSSGSGAFATNGLSFNTGTTWALAYLYSIINGGSMQHSGTAGNNKLLMGFNTWIRIDSVAATVNPQVLIGFMSSANASLNFPVLGVLNNSTNGLNLLFPTSTTALSTSSKMMAIQTNLYYWLSIRFAVDTNTIIADYYVNGVPVYTSINLTFTSDPLGNNTIDSVGFFGNNSGCAYTLDDFHVQMVNGGMSNWPAGSTSGNPNPAILTDIPVITPRRIYTSTLISNGSENDWTPSNGSLQNYQAVLSGTDFVESLNPGDIDLYKINVDPAISNPISIATRLNSNKTLNVNPVTRETSTSNIVTSGITNKGIGTILSIQETSPSGSTWTNANLKNAEFGEQSI